MFKYVIAAATMLIGLISDTHGLMRQSALDALRGCDVILHAGDVGEPAVLSALRDLAPVHAVRGNVDPRGGPLPASVDRDLAGVRVHISHGHELGSPTPAAVAAAYDADVVIFGHTHRALVEWVGTTLAINPGAAGPGRFDIKPSVALLTLPQREARIVWL